MAGAGEPKASNGEIVSESGEAYENKSYAIEAAERFSPREAEMEFEFESELESEE